MLSGEATDNTKWILSNLSNSRKLLVQSLKSEDIQTGEQSMDLDAKMMLNLG